MKKKRGAEIPALPKGFDEIPPSPNIQIPVVPCRESHYYDVEEENPQERRARATDEYDAEMKRLRARKDFAAQEETRRQRQQEQREETQQKKEEQRRTKDQAITIAIFVAKRIGWATTENEAIACLEGLDRRSLNAHFFRRPTDIYVTELAELRRTHCFDEHPNCSRCIMAKECQYAKTHGVEAKPWAARRDAQPTFKQSMSSLHSLLKRK